MGNLKLISIIIPTFGRPEHLVRAIKSVLNQTYENIEIIIVDDNGRNTKYQKETYKKIKTILRNDKRIKYIAHESNKNGSAARNTGLSYASGEYVCFLDDDDEFLPDKINAQIGVLNSRNTNWIAVYTGHIRKFNEKSKDERVYKPEKQGEILYDILSFAIDHCAGSSLMVKTKYAKKVNGWNENLKRHQDYEFIAKLAYEGNIAVISEPKVIINVHEGSNRQKDFYQIEKTRLAYIQNISYMFKMLTAKEIIEVKYINNFWLLKKSLQHREIKKVLYYFIQCNRPFYTISLLFKDIVRYILKGLMIDDK